MLPCQSGFCWSQGYEGRSAHKAPDKAQATINRNKIERNAARFSCGLYLIELRIERLLFHSSLVLWLFVLVWLQIPAGQRGEERKEDLIQFSDAYIYEWNSKNENITYPCRAHGAYVLFETTISNVKPHTVVRQHIVHFSAVILFCPPGGAVGLPYIQPHSCITLHYTHTKSLHHLIFRNSRFY